MRIKTDDLESRMYTCGLPKATAAESLGLSYSAFLNKLHGARAFRDEELKQLRRLVALYEQTAQSKIRYKVR